MNLYLMTRASAAVSTVIVGVGLSGASTDQSANSRREAALESGSLRLFTYTPNGCRLRMVLIVFHGQARDAEAYRDHAKPFADRNCAFVVAPEFDRSRFPRDLYQYGGVVRLPPGKRPIDEVQPLIDRVNHMIDAPDLPVVLYGHSAGGQFLSRVVAFSENKASLTIIANPSTWVFADGDVPLPDGLGETDAAQLGVMKRYLGKPVVMALGELDHGRRNLASDEAALQEGPDRYSRGINAYERGKASADAHGWPFNWRLVEVSNVGHDAKAMLDSPEIQSSVDRILLHSER